MSSSTKSVLICVLFTFAILICAATVIGADDEAIITSADNTAAESKIEEEERLEDIKEEAERVKREEAQALREQARAKRAAALARVEEANLPEDNTAKLTVTDVQFTGNTLISTSEIIKNMPMIWSSTGEPISKTASENLYDFRTVNEAIVYPGQQVQVSARTIQGFTAYVLSLYQERNYAGIYVYVPKGAMVGTNQLRNNVLVIEILESQVSGVAVKSYDIQQNEKEEGYLHRSFIERWSPAKSGKVANEKEVSDFVNLLNENPDRFVSANFKEGEEPNTLAVDYDVYEVSPWHWFIQLDNSGTRDRQWTPRIGMINTNLLGMDDIFAIIYQAPWDSEFTEQWSLFGSYDVPLMGPKLRLQVYAGYSEFDINPDSGPFNFIGNGSFVGSVLRYNVLQTEADTPLLGNDWFFDVKGMLEYDRSKVTPSLFPQALASDVKFWMWGWGLDLHRRTDVTDSQIVFDYWQSGMGQSDATAFARARAGAPTDFSIYDFSARHSQYLDPNKVNRISGTFRWVGTDDRLIPAKMTSFGGMYTVRGYDEYEIVADAGILASVQYEYDLVAADKASMTAEEIEREELREKSPLEIKKAAPLVFFDYGRAKINDARAGIGESEHTELMSAGIGGLLDLGDNFNGAIYYGYPLRATDDTREGKGRVNVSFMLRW